jgi:phosphomannomutase
VSELIISVSGLRGLIGSQLTPATVVRYLSAFASALPERGAVVVARDGRASGRALAMAAAATLAAHGFTVLDADVAATPTVGRLVREHRALGAIQISASHNPIQYNGIKLFGPQGRVLPAEAGERVRQAYLASQAAWVEAEQYGALESLSDPHADHLASLLQLVDRSAIAAAKFRVLLDSNRGAGSRLGRRLLEALGVEVVAVGQTPDGCFEHPPEPLEENLQGIAEQVRKHACQLGFCQDPDADRLAVIDEQGRYIGEECTLALCLLHVLEHRPGPVVINCATSSMAERLAESAGVPCYRSSVGEANVVDLMIEHQAVFGGEGNGGPIDPRVGWVRDSFVGMALILQLLVDRRQPLSQIVAQLPAAAMLKAKAPLTGASLPELFQRLEHRLAPPSVSHADGLRLAWPDRWLLVRGSNTEPIVRFIAEAPDAAGARALVEQAKQAAAD